MNNGVDGDVGWVELMLLLKLMARLLVTHH